MPLTENIQIENILCQIQQLFVKSNTQYLQQSSIDDPMEHEHLLS